MPYCDSFKRIYLWQYHICRQMRYAMGVKMDQYLMGIDVGTSGSKVAIYNLNGEVITSAYHSYEIIYPYKGAMELDADEVFEAVLDCIGSCSKACNLEKAAALSISTQGEAIILVDENDKPLLPAIITFDSRNEKEFQWFCRQFSKEEIMQRTGMPMHTMFSATKILYIKNHYKSEYGRAKKIMCFGDYIAYRLGAASAIDYSMASRTMLFDIREKIWSDRILTVCGIKKELLPGTVKSGTVIGSVKTEYQERFGFGKKVKIVAGAHDQVCCALGAGILEPGLVMDSLGTTESNVSVGKNLVITEQMVKENIPVYCYPVGDLYAYMTFLTCSASILKWLKEKIVNDPGKEFYDEYSKYINEHYKEPTRLYVLPYFSGAGTPTMDFRAKGVIYGLTLDTDRYELYKAIIESTCYEQRINLENMERNGIAVNEVRCIGGGAKSDLILQVKANITGKKIVRMRNGEIGCLGAAIIAGIGSEILRDLSVVSQQFSMVENVFYPQAEQKEKYEKCYKEYLELYPACHKLWQA